MTTLLSNAFLRRGSRPISVLLLVIAWAMLAGVSRTSAIPAASSPSAPAAVAPAGASDPLAQSPDDQASPSPANLQSRIDRHEYAINFVWVLVCGFLVMFMQVGFALLETGLCRAKNAAHTMSMNFLVYALAMTGFFICGYALMCGGISAVAPGDTHPIIGGAKSLGGMPNLNAMAYIKLAGKPIGLFGRKGFFLLGGHLDPSALAWFLYMMVFLDTSATIPTGALAERWRFKSFVIFSLLIGAIIYPVYGCWMWGGGWLATLGHNFHLGHGAVDFAGSSVVHMQGGAIALVCAILLGPRIGKYDLSGRPQPILGHHIPMVVTGTLILAFGWFGFNAGSSLAGTDTRISLIAVNTMLASGAGALASTLYLWFFYGKPDPSMMCNGMLAGLVAITAPCAFVSPLAAFFIGLVAGVIGDFSVIFLERRGVDDPVGAVSVHLVCGVWGILSVGLFANGEYGAGWNGVNGAVRGLFYGDSGQLGAQCIAALTCILWNVLVASGVFALLGRLLGSNRVPPEVEVAGLDIPELGAPGYPEFITAIAPEMVSRSQIDALSGG